MIFLYRLKNVMPKHILKTIYNSLTNPYIHYCILAWGFNSDRILKLQKRAVRIITHSHFLAHTDNLFKSLKILKVDYIFKLHQLTFYHKFVNDNLPACLSDILIKQNTNLRSCHTSYFLKPPMRTNTENAKKCIRHSIPNFINSYDRNFINNIENLSIFTLKKQFKSFVFSQYTFECRELNCYSCNFANQI